MTDDHTPSAGEPSPRFKLPQRPPTAPPGSAAAKVACGLLVVVLAFQVYGVLRPSQQPAPATTGGSGPIPAVDLRAAAMRLEDRNLPLAGADAWKQYMDKADLKPVEQARILYRVGKLLMQSEQYEYATANLFLAEQLAGGQDESLNRQIAMSVRECLQKMGRYSELSREMAARATPNEENDDATLAGQQVVAQVGDEKITVTEFERMLRAKIDAAISARTELSPEQAEQSRTELNRQFAGQQAKTHVLQQVIASRVLAAEARRVKLDQSPNYRESLIAFADDMLATMLMNDEIAKRATLTSEDAKRYYDSNPERYTIPAQVVLAHIRCATETAAREVLAKARAGEDFAALAAEYSTDEQTKANGGLIRRTITKDADLIPGIGRQAELQAAMWAVASGDVLADVYSTDAGWHVVKVMERTDQQERAFDEVKEQVEHDARLARQQEVSKQYLDELFEQHSVKLYPAAFAMGAADKGEESE